MSEQNTQHLWVRLFARLHESKLAFLASRSPDQESPFMIILKAALRYAELVLND